MSLNTIMNIFLKPISVLSSYLTAIVTSNSYQEFALSAGYSAKRSIFSIVFNSQYKHMKHVLPLFGRRINWGLEVKTNNFTQSWHFSPAEEPGLVPMLAWPQTHGINQHRNHLPVMTQQQNLPLMNQIVDLPANSRKCIR